MTPGIFPHEVTANSTNKKDFAAILEPISLEMELLHHVISGFVQMASSTYFPEVDDLCRGGKRLRAAICIAMAKAFTSDEERLRKAIELAAYVEGIHLTSLLHDDVIDNASERRGIQTLHRRYGRTGAILAGDLLYVKIFHRLLELEQPAAMRVIVQGVIEMVEGETWQTIGAVTGREPSIEDYLGGIAKKTAAFIRAAAEGGALLGSPELSDSQRAAVRMFGHDFGMAFQIVDDILDWTADPELLGKELLADIKSSKLTLPLLLFIEDDAASARGFIARAADGAILPLSTEISRRGYLHRSYRIAERYAESAGKSLDLIDGRVDVLRDLVKFTLSRCF